MEIFIEALTNAILITGLVMIMMILIEYINVSSTGDALLKLRASKKRQVVLAAALGLIPGCVGGFAVVSLYARRVVSFGALIAMMIASSGDEAFIILALIPKEALFLFLFLFLIGISSGFIVDAIEERRAKTRGLQEEEPLPIVESECCGNESRESHPIFEGTIWGNLKRMSRKRAFMLLGITLFIVAIVSGLLEHEHLHDSLIEGEHLHDSLEHHHHFNIFNERWINLLFAGLSLVILFVTAKTSDHFISHHLWDHVIKKHLLSIFLWTFAALLVIHLAIGHITPDHWALSNGYLLILLAVTIGLIPESGPHMVFITLYASGLIPVSVLVASSISQDGHTSLPLLAHNKISFAKAKLINLLVGAIVGALLYTFGF